MDYNFSLLNSADTTSLPSDIAAVAASTGTSLWVPVVIAAGIAVGFIVLRFIVSIFKGGKTYYSGKTEEIKYEYPSETDIVMKSYR